MKTSRTTYRHLATLVGSIALLGVGCEPLSTLPEGLDDAVLYQLSPETMDILEHADRVVVHALGEPNRDPALRGPALPGPGDNRPVVGEAEVTEHPLDFTRAIYRALAGARGQLLCFIPHHRLVVHAGHRSVAFTICFHCMTMFSSDGPDVLGFDPGPLQPLLDAALETQAGIVLVDDREDPFAPPRWLPVERPATRGAPP